MIKLKNKKLIKKYKKQKKQSEMVFQSHTITHGESTIITVLYPHVLDYK